MHAFRILIGSALALGLLVASCGDDGEITTGLSAGSMGGSGGGSSGGSSGGGPGESSGSVDPTSNPTGGDTTSSPTTTAGSSSTTLPPVSTTSGGEESTGGSGSSGGGSSSGGNTTDGAGCGNGKIDATEQCDGGNLNGFDCVSLGNAGGTLLCDPVTCTFDTSMCEGSSSDGTSG
jgi:hypothetical protein